jgi:hypothetical protein
VFPMDVSKAQQSDHQWGDESTMGRLSFCEMENMSLEGAGFGYNL